jgi:hypothetical protein
MYIACTKQNPSQPVLMKVRRGNSVLVFKTIDDANYYLNARNGQYCALKFLPDAIRENPIAYSSISKMLYLNTRDAVESLLKDAANFPYEEFTVPLPK